MCTPEGHCEQRQAVLPQLDSFGMTTAPQHHPVLQPLRHPKGRDRVQWALLSEQESGRGIWERFPSKMIKKKKKVHSISMNHPSGVCKPYLWGEGGFSFPSRTGTLANTEIRPVMTKPLPSHVENKGTVSALGK